MLHSRPADPCFVTFRLLAPPRTSDKPNLSKLLSNICFVLSGLRPFFLLTSKVVGVQVPVMTFVIRHSLATFNGAEEVQFIQAVRRILEERYLHRFEPYISNQIFTIFSDMGSLKNYLGTYFTTFFQFFFSNLLHTTFSTG